MGSFSNKKCRLLWSIVLGVAVMLLLGGCNPDRNKPYNFLNSVWVCEEAHACIAVTERESRAYSYGEIERDGTTVPITIVYFNGLQGALLDFSKAYSYLFQTTDWYGPNCAFQQDGELFYQFSQGGGILFFR